MSPELRLIPGGGEPERNKESEMRVQDTIQEFEALKRIVGTLAWPPTATLLGERVENGELTPEEFETIIMHLFPDLEIGPQA